MYVDHHHSGWFLIVGRVAQAFPRVVGFIENGIVARPRNVKWLSAARSESIRED